MEKIKISAAAMIALTAEHDTNAVYGKSGAAQGLFGARAPGVEGTLYDPDLDITNLPRGGKMIGPATADKLREYITRDIEYTESVRKRLETDQIINEALEMQRRGRPAPIPRPTYLAVAIRAIYDDLETWSLK